MTEKKPIAYKAQPHTPLVIQVEGADGNSYFLSINTSIVNVFDRGIKDNKTGYEQFEVGLSVMIHTTKVDAEKSEEESK